MINFFFSILKTLKKKYNYQIFILIISLVLLSFIDLIGISLFPGLVILLFDVERLISYSKQLNLDHDLLLNFLRDENHLIFFSLFILLLFVIKNFLFFIINYYQAKIFKNIQVDLSKNLFQSYLDLNYEKFISYNSAKIIRNVTSEVTHLKSFISKFVELIKEVFLFLIIFFALIFVDYKITFFIIFVFLLFLFIYYLTIKSSLKRSSEIAQLFRFEFLKLVNQSINVYKIIKIFNLKNNILNRFEFNLNKEEKELLYQNIASILPKIFLEIIAIIVLLSSILIITANPDRDNIENLSIISFFGVALIRLLPSINSISINITQLKIFKIPAETILKELNSFHLKKKSAKKMDEYKPNIIKKSFDTVDIKNLNFSYFGGKTILNNLNFSFKKGDIVGIFGPSGSGKSTFVDLLMGVISNYNGLVTVDNIDVKKDITNWQKKFGYVPQENYIFDDTLTNNITFGFSNKIIDKSYLKKIINISKLSQLKSIILNDSKRKIGLGDRGSKISGGQKQRIGIARALFSKPEILILDESLSALDNKTKISILCDLKKIRKKITLIIISHDTTLKKYCNKILNLN